MDPNATLARLRAACENPDEPDSRDEALNALADLSLWLSGGGFMPRYIVCDGNVTPLCDALREAADLLGNLTPRNEAANRWRRLADGAMVGLKPFTVLLRYPDYLSSDGETYLAHVMAEDTDGAVDGARDQAFAFNGMDSDLNDPADFAEMMVFRGHISAQQLAGPCQRPLVGYGRCQDPPHCQQNGELVS